MKKLTILILSFLVCLSVSCTGVFSGVGKNLNGYYAVISINTNGVDEKTLSLAYADTVGFLDALGYSAHEFEASKDGLESGFVQYSHPEHNVVFYNVATTVPEHITISIRDDRRTYSGSPELRAEVKRLMCILRKHFDEKRITYKQYSTFLI